MHCVVTSVSGASIAGRPARDVSRTSATPPSAAIATSSSARSGPDTAAGMFSERISGSFDGPVWKLTNNNK